MTTIFVFTLVTFRILIVIRGKLDENYFSVVLILLSKTTLDTSD